LANDLLGFHTQYHCNNFLDVIDKEIESKIDRERFSVIKKGHETLVRPYPISVDFEGIDAVINTAAVQEKEKSLVQEFGLSGRKVLIGLDRIDYTKGLPDKLRAFNRLLERYPELCGQVVFLQVGVITRLHIKKYKELNDEINALVEEINWKYGVPHWTPVIFIRRQFSLTELIALYRISTAAVVSSLHDGMNLVAKEYVSSQSGRKGMLILSQFTGAARELTEAILINPYDCDQFSEGIFQALTLPEDDRQKRMMKMRETVSEYNIYHWAGRVISELLKFEFQN
jgi:trehalose 6-phosphate synthase